MNSGNNGSVIFSIDTFGESFNVLKTLSQADGTTPYGSLIQIDTTLYGMTSEGGTNSDGVIFSLTSTGNG